MEYKEAAQTLVEQIKTMVEGLISKAKFDATYFGYIQEVESNTNGIYLYKITIDGKNKKIKSKTAYSVGDYVMVLIPRNNWNRAVIIRTD